MPFQVFSRGRQLMLVSVAAADTSAAFGFRRRTSRGSSRLVSSSVKGLVSATVRIVLLHSPNGGVNRFYTATKRTDTQQTSRNKSVSSVWVRNVHGFDPMFTGFPAYIVYNIRWSVQVSRARSLHVPKCSHRREHVS